MLQLGQRDRDRGDVTWRSSHAYLHGQEASEMLQKTLCKPNTVALGHWRTPITTLHLDHV